MKNNYIWLGMIFTILFILHILTMRSVSKLQAGADRTLGDYRVALTQHAAAINKLLEIHPELNRR